MFGVLEMCYLVSARCGALLPGHRHPEDDDHDHDDNSKDVDEEEQHT